ncbi:peptidyl-prolyl cis-trans isomerase cyclophilin type [Pelagophyceae sp. CCMP2097]|nr:peptidyl-prolyl cis-trans isomerase cyclophilin type [Pelagophyceae sp. CCMP2097]|mmetsp:Transcript_26364/g.88626  ORF Transcript_26364/g.88626 Transcript_26364/m.88626 type:complete len:198 (-) Transcript_26364:78-671(-)|eukprot:CAMPEP_0184090790 /NCGR_PEP_ID=MMETSP0974-20121125/7407_1 /TAXON_ID=483370 /ORGANISM="non described non described, Strain CCMP2097" /LENGTH=197 /DNA_ID=CAMNT_0026393515 /DNA_START=12 /DNA_END=605 /DNA_ORIENTATION=+
MAARSLLALVCACAAAAAPAHYTVTFETDGGAIIVAVDRDLAPLGADRLYATVSAGFYNDSAFFRVVPGFVTQFGISGSAAENAQWLHSSIDDDPVLSTNGAGTLAFATEGPNSRTTQLFFNLKNNAVLDSMGFSPFGKIISGLAVAENMFNPTPSDDGGVDQQSYEEKGNAWVRKTFPGIQFITGAFVKEETEATM